MIAHLQSAGHIDGAFSDPLKIRELASKSDVLTVEIEHVNVDALEAAGVKGKTQIHPSPTTLRTIQDKFLQKSIWPEMPFQFRNIALSVQQKGAYSLQGNVSASH